MLTGLRGERQLADLIGAAIAAARPSVGESSEPLKETSGEVRRGHAAAKMRVASLTLVRRHDVAKQTATARWK